MKFKLSSKQIYLIIFDTTPAPTVLPPSRIAKRKPSSIATGAINLTIIFVLSPGITISLPAGLRMNAIASHGGTTKVNFEAFSLAASIVGKCHFCVKAHYETLKTEGYTVEQLRDIGRIASVMNSVAKVLNS